MSLGTPAPTGPLVYFPPQSWGTKGSSVPADYLNRMAKSSAERLMNLAAIGSPLPLIYGAKVQVPALVLNAIPAGGYWYFDLVWGEGPLTSIDKILLDGEALPAGSVYNHYLGNEVQAFDPMLAYAHSRLTPAQTYTDTLPYIAHTVVRIPAALITGRPEFVAEVQGLACYDHRSLTTQVTSCPALILANVLSNSRYGMGLSMDWASVDAVANLNDAAVGATTTKRRTLGISIDRPQSPSSWIDLLRAYASCWVVLNGDQVSLVPYAARASEITFSHSNAEIIDIEDYERKGLDNLPTGIEVRFTDVSGAGLWKDGYATVWQPGVDVGVVPRRLSKVAMPGIQSYQEAYRFAIERLNALSYEDLSFSFTARGKAIQVTIGTVITFNFPETGIAVKDFWVIGVEPAGGGYRISVLEYSANSFSDMVVTAPPGSDSSLPDPSSPPAIENLIVTERAYQKQNGQWATRLEASWDPIDWYFPFNYKISLYEDEILIVPDLFPESRWASPELKEGVEYSLRVSVMSGGAEGPVSIFDKVAEGKTMPPGNVPSINVLEAGGEVRITVGAGTDSDMLGYEIRRASVGGDWSAGTFVDFINAASGVGGYTINRSVPAGTYDFLVCVLDSVGQYSPTPARQTVTVTVDDSSYLVPEYFFTGAASLFHMVEFHLRGDPRTYWITEPDVSMSSQFPSAMNTYGNPIVSYHGAWLAEWLSNTYDFGTVITGDWRGASATTVLAGSVNEVLELSVDGSVWSQYPLLSAKATGRFARIRVTAATTSSSFQIKVPGPSVYVAVQAKEESGSGLSSASAGVLVQLTKTFFKVTGVHVDPVGSTNLSGIPDRILVGPDFGLMLQSIVDTGSGDAYIYQNLYDYAAGSRTMLSDDYLEYDVLIIETAHSSAHSIGGIVLKYSTGAYSNDATLLDQYGVPMEAWGYITTPKGVWHHRKIALAAEAGLLLKRVAVINDADIAGTYGAIIKNVTITNGSGTVRATFYGTSGEPQANSVEFTSRQKQAQMGPANSFLANVWQAYGTSSTRAPANTPFNFKFEGVGV